MHSQRQHIRWLVTAAAAALVAAALIPAAAAAKPFIPGVTDSGTGVLRDVAQKGSGEAFIPGVTDSTTGVTRDLARRGLEPRPFTPTAGTNDSGIHLDDGTIGMAAALAAALLMAAAVAVVRAKEARA